MTRFLRNVTRDWLYASGTNPAERELMIAYLDAVSVIVGMEAPPMQAMQAQEMLFTEQNVVIMQTPMLQ